MPGKRPEEPVDDLNLVPIMNLVLILIPLLLLSIVFLEIAVLDVTMPESANAANPNDTDEEPKRLRLFIDADGIRVLTLQGGVETTLPAIDECSADGLTKKTICLKNPSAETLVQRYNWVALYDELMRLKKNGWDDHTSVEVIASPDITFDVLVRVMDTVRHQRVPEGTVPDSVTEGVLLDDEATFLTSQPVLEEAVDKETGQTGKRNKALFPQVILGTWQGAQ